MPDPTRRLSEADAIFLPMGEAVGGAMAPVGVAILAGPIDPAAESHQRELLARLIPAARRRIVRDRFSLALPRWVDVPGFDPDDGWVELPAPGDRSLRAVLDWAGRWAALPFAAGRPPWRSARFDGVTVDGVAGRTVLVSQVHHALIDGGGARRMIEHYLRFEADAPLAPLPPPPPVEHITAWDRWKEGWALEGQKAAATARAGAQRLRTAARQPRHAARRTGELVRAGVRLQAPVGPVPLSPLLRRRSDQLRFDELEIDLAALKAGARAAGGSINDGLMAATSLGLRAWHRDLGVSVPMLRTAMAVDRRTPGTKWDGNDALAVVLLMPCDDDDPARLIKRCREVSLAAREDRDALWLLDRVRAVQRRGLVQASVDGRGRAAAVGPPRGGHAERVGDGDDEPRRPGRPRHHHLSGGRARSGAPHRAPAGRVRGGRRPRPALGAGTSPQRPLGGRHAGPAPPPIEEPPVSPNDPTPEPNANEPAPDGDEPVMGRQPPGPDDVPIANLPPPSGDTPLDEEAEAPPVDPPDPESESGPEPERDPDADPDSEAEPGPGPGPEPDRGPESELEGDDEPALEGEPVATVDSVQEIPDEPAPEAVVAPAHPHRWWTRTRVTFVAVLVAVAASTVALTKAQQVGDLTSQRDDRRAIERVSERFGAAYLSFDFEHADSSATAVRALATPSFAASYAAQSAPGIQELFSSRQTRTRATTTAVYLGPVTSSSAEALVVVDVTATSATEGDQRLDDVSFVLDLARTDHGWRVANVARAPQPSLGGTTSTTAAAPPP